MFPRELAEVPMTVLAAYPWKTNAHLIEDVAKLGYLDGLVLDATYGLGTWWKRWQPPLGWLVKNDLRARGEALSYDFRGFPVNWADRYDVVAFDPPYKLNGTPDPSIDSRYGVHVATTWVQRHHLIREGIKECRRVLKPGGYLLLKCQDQVCSGQIRWQTDTFTEYAWAQGLVKVDRFDMLGTGRPQPEGRRQVHAHQRPSTLLVFQKS
jgi:SAM-dependent methyltransferase